MGNRFADNSRFLYQYLYNNRANFGIQRLFWATRDRKIYDCLLKNGYQDVLLCGTFRSFWYHIKSGVHIICNSDGKDQKGDIDTHLSFGAKKIQLWHGVGNKACYKLARDGKHSLKYWFIDNIYRPLSTPGNWHKCYFLVTSEQNARFATNDLGIKKKKLIYALYPRLLPPIKLLDFENDIVKKLYETKKHQRLILYLPTFRKNANELFVHPLSIKGFTDFLINNNIIWIEKRHSADKIDHTEIIHQNVFYLDDFFDVNLLYKYVDMVITDYSSAASDAIYNEILTIEYCPDYDWYLQNDRGFNDLYENCHVGNLVKSSSKLSDTILALFDSGLDVSKNNSIKFYLFDSNYDTYETIVNKIINIAIKKPSSGTKRGD